jgi:hypothetical protein
VLDLGSRIVYELERVGEEDLMEMGYEDHLEYGTINPDEYRLVRQIGHLDGASETHVVLDRKVSGY